MFPAESVAVPSNDPVNKILYLKEGNTVTCSSVSNVMHTRSDILGVGIEFCAPKLGS